MSILLICVLLATASSWAAPPVEKLLDLANASNGQQQEEQKVHLQRLVNSVEKSFVENADELHKKHTPDNVHLTVVNLTKQEGLESLVPLLPAFKVPGKEVDLIMPEIKNNSGEIKEKLILKNKDIDHDDVIEITTMAPKITTLINDNYDESNWETTTMDADMETTTKTTNGILADEIENNSKLLISTITPTTTTTTAKTPLNELKETEKELKEKIAEIEAEPLILSARV